jgi:hypothetical protein
MKETTFCQNVLPPSMDTFWPVIWEEAPKGFIKRQDVRFIDNDIESNIFWSLIIAEK